MSEGQPEFHPNIKQPETPPRENSFEEISKPPEVSNTLPSPDSSAPLILTPEKPTSEQLPPTLKTALKTADVVNTRQVSITPTKPNGFREHPFKVVRNSLLYPTTEENVKLALGTGATAISSYVVTLTLGYPEIGGAISLITAALLMGEFGSLFIRQKQLSTFLRVHKNRITEEKVLADGTTITLDDSVGELHVSGTTRIWKMRFEKDRTKRALVIMEGILAGLVNLADKSQTDPWFQNIVAFKGTSHIVNPNIAQRFGFQVEQPQGIYESMISRYIRSLDRILTLMPSDLGNQPINIAWISKAGLISHKEVIQAELDKVRRALSTRNKPS